MERSVTRTVFADELTRMYAAGRVVSLLVGWLITCSTEAIATERIEVPIKPTTLTDGEIRYSVSVRVGRASPIEAMLDTGSAGLRILRAAVPDQAYTVSERSSTYGFSSGVRLLGVIADATVTIGQAATDGPVPVEIVNSVDCSPRVPRCPASRLNAADYRIGGDGLARQGFSAIVGINMGNADAVNPLTRTGDHSWIVMLPRPGEARAGTLIINPSADDRMGYTLFPTDEVLRRSQAGFHDAITGCLASDKPRKQICGPTLLDSGAPGFHISSANAADLSGWKMGLGMEIAFKNESGAELNTKFVADSSRPSQFSMTSVPDQPRTRISAGSLPYFAFSVLYDAEQSVVGLKRR